MIARYPKRELHENEHTRIHAWRYNGGVHGLILAFFKAAKFIKKEKLSLSKIPVFTYYFAGDWELTNKIIKSDLSNRPCITAEIYPNANKGRILLSTLHPQYMIWWDGYIKEQNSDRFNCLAYGLYQWKNITKPVRSINEELTHNWWIVRRSVAWAAKIPDDELPPITRQKITEKDKAALSKNIIWDGTLLNQIENI